LESLHEFAEIWPIIGNFDQWRCPDSSRLLAYVLSAKRRVEGTPWISGQDPYQHGWQAALQQPLDHCHSETAPETPALIGGKQVDGIQFALIESITTALGASRGKPDDLSCVLRGNIYTARRGRGR
jgi:hypothetical protein